MENKEQNPNKKRLRKFWRRWLHRVATGENPNNVFSDNLTTEQRKKYIGRMLDKLD